MQAARDLRADGIAGPLTLAALRRANGVVAPGAGYTGPGGAAVRALQRHLARSGFSPGPIDGRYGPRTEHAVARFQAAHRLQADGIVGPRTVAVLGSSLATAGHLEHRRPHSASSTSQAKPTSAVPSGPSNAVKPPATNTAAPAGHPAGSSSVGLLALLLALLLGLAGAIALATIWLSRRKHAEPADEAAAAGAATKRPGPVTAGTAAGATADQPTAESAAQPRRQVNAERLFALGAELEQRGERDHARHAYERADQLGHGPAACNLGVLLDQDGQRAEAEAVFRRAAQRGDGSGAFNLGALLEEGGDLDGAFAAYKHAEQLGNEDVAAMARQARRELQGQLGRLPVARKGGAGNGA
ncbi:MAG: peptidoglycan-binding protein [Solirubrobacterales bacterium]|nr:peptidoglycan-binding protein [Solirubrobacterales bacterium]